MTQLLCPMRCIITNEQFNLFGITLEECSMCLEENITKVVALTCGHCICIQCANDLMKKFNSSS
jgi:hypothetical protein